MRVIFMGTPDFAVGALESILAAGHEVSLVVTQPDKPKGRKREPVPPPVKERALAHGLSVFQPEKIRDEAAVSQLRGQAADICVVAAYGQILPQEVLELPRFGCVNIHASLLPKYRGASPIQQALLNGDEASGVTIMQMDKGMDTGAMLLKRMLAISPDDTAGTLFEKLSALGARLIVEALPQIEDGTLKGVAQNEADASYCVKLDKSMGQIRWGKSARSIENLIRAADPWPSAYTRWNGRLLKLWKARALPEKQDVYAAGDRYGGSPAPEREMKDALPGTVTSVGTDLFTVATGGGELTVTEVQPEGKRRMTAEEFLRGHTLRPGDRLL